MPPSGLDPAAGLAVVDEGEVAVGDDGGDDDEGDATLSCPSIYVLLLAIFSSFLCHEPSALSGHNNT